MSEGPAPKQAVTDDDIAVGSFFLETLTTGMYENPFHCIREYVQNSFDAIRASQRDGVSNPGEGRVVISISGSPAKPNMSIRDDGSGIVASAAVSTLVSLGSSRKTPALDAGFRGIGRLAGIAYCTLLRFGTSAVGEAVSTIVEFDCGKIRGYLTPGADPQDVRDVVRKSVTWRQEPAPEHEHFMDVEMQGLVGLGLDFVKVDELIPYLSQVCPVDYVDTFNFGDRIRQLALGFGDPVPVIEVATRSKKERVPIHKPYRNTTAVGGKNQIAQLYDIETFTSREHGWYGWVGLSNFPGELTDDAVAGVRFRLKNIQVGDASIIEDLAEELTASGTERRLQRWAVGEIFVANPRVVPNARRDGFEDNRAWRDLKKDVKERVAKRVISLVRDASESRSTLKKVRVKFDELKRRLQVPTLKHADFKKLETELNREVGKLDSERMRGADPQEVNVLVSNFKELQERLGTIPIEQPPAPVPAPPPPPPAPPAPPPPPPKTFRDVTSDVLEDELGAAEAERLLELIDLRWGTEGD